MRSQSPLDHVFYSLHFFLFAVELTADEFAKLENDGVGDGVDDANAFLLTGKESGLVHELEMLGNDRLTHATESDQFTDGFLSFLEFLKEFQAASVSEDPENGSEFVESRRSHF